VFSSLIKEYKVDLVLQGHEHGYARMTNDNHTTPVYLISHSSPKDYKHTLTGRVQKYDRGGRYYQRIDISSDSLILKAYNQNDSLIDRLSIDYQIKKVIDK
jgi:hypothetical protein